MAVPGRLSTVPAVHPTACRLGKQPRGAAGGSLTELPGRIVALDYGRRRIGVAVSDPSRTLATPHSTVPNPTGGPEPPPKLMDLLRELEPAAILVGIPLNMDGTEGRMAKEARRFGARLAQRSGIRVIERDERLTSVEAEERMRKTGRRRRDRGHADRVAAAVLLEDYLSEGTGSE